MKNIFFSAIMILWKCLLIAQVPDWSTDIAPIIYSNCSSCHHQGTVAPFPLMSYQDAFNNATEILTQVNNHYMPP